jgi:hypothetical protein
VPFSIQINQSKQLLFIEGRGVLSDDDVTAMMKGAIAHSEAGDLIGVLLNLTHVDDMGTSQDAVKWAAATSRRTTPVHGLRFAVVAPEDIAFGLARMYELLRDQEGSIHVFREYDPALQWLEDPSTNSPAASDS